MKSEKTDMCMYLQGLVFDGLLVTQLGFLLLTALTHVLLCGFPDRL